MIERLARVAIEARRGEDFNPSRFHVRLEEQVIREVLTALREPTPEMVAEATSEYVGDIDALLTWQAMIDAALTKGEG
ncbi:hypothetical protein [Sphingomonas sp.]|uniref:hypothetical protein n=1 Tax=Sphingomonas sp. TaxID=28214 RepID=UPI0031DDE8D3